MEYRVQAIARVTRFLPMEKDQKNRPGKVRWLKYSMDTEKGAVDFIQAVQSKRPMAVKKAAIALQNNCNQCHREFRL